MGQYSLCSVTIVTIHAYYSLSVSIHVHVLIDHLFQLLWSKLADAGELMHMEGPSTFQECTTIHAGVLSSVRHHLKKNHFHAFDALLDALQHYDKVSMTL